MDAAQKSEPIGRGALQEIRARAARSPNAIAVEERGRSLSYAELVRAADSVAAALRAAGVSEGMLVGHCFERSADAVAAVLGILASGAAYVPVDPRYPADRIALALTDADVALVLADPSSAGVVAGLDRPVLVLEGSTIAGESRARPDARRIDGAAYVIYTSGSTGRPKGVIVDHAALAAYGTAMRDRIGVREDDRYLHTASFSFSSSVRQWLVPLVSGATIVMAGRQDIADARALLALMAAERVTVADLVPSYLRSCIQALRDEDIGTRRALLDNALRLLLTASEPLPCASVHAWRTELGHPATMINMFGQTETAGIVATLEIPSALPADGIVPIGAALPGLELLVLDESGAVSANGTAGELAVSGPTLGVGYVGMPEATSARFVTLVDGPARGRRIYRTGDRVRPRTDGAMDFLGRQDTQVKVRGHRVELEEVEARLMAHPSVAEAAVVARPSPDGETTLVAMVTPAPGAEIDPRALRRFAGAGLPEYMVPSAVLRTERLPRTPNGKLDRGALPTVDAERLELSHAFVAPRSDDERLIAAAWSELLGLPRIGADDDFFELGGHSLIAMRAMARLRSETGVALPVRALFEHPTVAGLGAALAAARATGPAKSRPALQPKAHSAEIAPSFAQKRLWLLHQLDKDSAAYNLLAAIRLVGPLDRAALERAVTHVVERHEGLRTIFPNVAGEPRAVVTRGAPVALPVRMVPDEATMRAEVKALAGAPYDLERGPLVRSALLGLGPEEHVLFVGMHHIVSDGWSRGVLYDELVQLYSAFATGASNPLPPLPIQFSDYVSWQEEWFAQDGLEGQLEWWLGSLKGAPVTSELPTQRARPAVQTFEGATHSFPLAGALAREVRQLGAEEGASPFMVYLAALAAVLGRYTGQEDVVIGSPTAGRADPATESLIGFFVNTLALRVDMTGGPSFREIVRRTRDVSLGAFNNQDLPFDRVVDALELPRDLSRSPLFQVMFILQNTPPATHRPAGLTMSQVDVTLDAAKYDLTLSLVTGEHGLTGHLEYNTGLFDEAFIARIGGHFVRLLESAVASPDAHLADLGILTAADERQLVVEWNATEREVPALATVHALFEAQVRRTPDAEAIAFGDDVLTYAELDRRASVLAAHLIRQGVGRETLVGVCVERSIEMMVGLFGILKAGGAYVPLDPTYPRDRLAHMVEDSRCPIILTQEHLLGHLPRGSALRICLDRDWPRIAETPSTPVPMVDAEQIAYVIYTSGSTGRPKGVMVEHRNVVNFFAGMDERIGRDQPITWLAVTSISFDISVLELFWTLTRGAKVVIQPDEPQVPVGTTPAVANKSIDFSLFYFASEAASPGADPYTMLFEGARFADSNGFSAVWVPERHFHEFGGIYPSPAVLSGALAAVTRRIKLRTGSVVLPLHDTLRVAEDWAVVDNLSRGRVELSFASGWHDRDFVFQPQHYADRRTVMMHQIEELRALWRGESITRPGGEGTPHQVVTHPRPVQPELPIFVTAAGTPQTYERAGQAGAHLLTHLLGQSVDQLAGKIKLYREAWEKAGHPGRGIVALMMHAYAGEDIEEVRQTVWHPFREYLRSSVGLIGDLAKGRGQDLRGADFSAEDMEALLDHAFERYFQTSALMGTPESCLAMVEKLKSLDVDDVACLIDFGIPEEKVLASLDLLADVHRRANPRTVGPAESAADQSVPAHIARHRVTHMQCTPSYAEMLLALPGGREALASLECLMVGGEALPLALAKELTKTVRGRVMNMYGPTETTIWSSTDTVDVAKSGVTLGRPIANTEMFVVDRALRLVPIGVPGELLIGGKGVVRGYWERPELTAERFVAHPFVPGQRVYRTGDLVRYLGDGRLEFLGRLDHQVKVRGHRIELGEIEALLREQPGVREAVVVAREDVIGDKRLVGYVVLDQPMSDAEAVLRDALRVHLPEWMVPQHVVRLDALPLTPNGKTDRKQLPAPDVVVSTQEFVAPASDLERVIAEVWQDVLRRPAVGTQDNFFDLGGHSLLTVRVQAALRERLGRVVPITDIFRFPTIRTLAARLSQDGAGAESDKAVTESAAERAEARRGALAKRRGRGGNPATEPSR